MNDRLKNILKIVESVAAASVPGGQMVDGAVHQIIASKGKSDSGYLDAAQGAIQVVEEIDGEDIADEMQFRTGVAMVEAGIKMIRGALKSGRPSDGTPAPKA